MAFVYFWGPEFPRKKHVLISSQSLKCTWFSWHETFKMLADLEKQMAMGATDIKLCQTYQTIFTPRPWLSQFPLALKRQHDYGNAYNEEHFTGTWFSFKGLVLYHHGGKHGST